MKLHITEEQLNELSEKAKTELFRWYANTPLDFRKGVETTIKNGIAYLPLLSIGQMIEFLDETWNLPNYWFIESEGHARHEEFPHEWNIYISGALDEEDDLKGNAAELCDALWLVVKQELEA